MKRIKEGTQMMEFQEAQLEPGSVGCDLTTLIWFHHHQIYTNILL